MQLLVATRNKDKLKELAAMLHDLQIDVISVADMPRLPEIVEDGATIRDNAIKKAVETARVAKKLTLADDTGLEVDVLKGEPGCGRRGLRVRTRLITRTTRSCSRCWRAWRTRSGRRGFAVW